MALMEEYKRILEQGWERCPDKDMNPRPRYASLLAQLFLGFVGAFEKFAEAIVKRMDALEARIGGSAEQATVDPQPVQIDSANGEETPARPPGVPADFKRGAVPDGIPPFPQAPGHNGNGNGNGSGGTKRGSSQVPPNLIRVSATGDPLTSEEQRMEESVDLQLNQQIDMTRYRERRPGDPQ